MQRISNISILGGGLLGGSIALAAGKHFQTKVWSRRAEAAAEAQSLGLHATTDLATAVRSADLLILCVPVGAMAALLEQAIAAGLPAHCLITDVGSVKRLPHEALRSIVQEKSLDFIGSHPMAGGEKGGIAQARADLFHNAACLLTNDENCGADQAAALEEFWLSLGCRTSWTDANTHDALVARVSHFPHLLAAVGATVSLKDPTLAGFGGGGLRDTTRVAAGNPQMWAEILCENRHSVISAIDEAMIELQHMKKVLEDHDQAAAYDWLSVAKKRRDVL